MDNKNYLTRSREIVLSMVLTTPFFSACDYNLESIQRQEQAKEIRQAHAFALEVKRIADAEPLTPGWSRVIEIKPPKVNGIEVEVSVCNEQKVCKTKGTTFNPLDYRGSDGVINWGVYVKAITAHINFSPAIEKL